MSEQFNEHVPEAVHADDLDVSPEELASAFSYDEPEDGIEVTDTPQMTETKAEDEPEEVVEEENAEEEPEATTEEEPAEEEQEVEEEQPAHTDQPRIPKSRFDEVNKRAKDAEAKAEALQREFEALKAGMQQGQPQQPQQPQQQPEQKPQFDFNAKEQQYMDAVLDGETDKALAIRNEIREAERAEFQSVAQTKSTESVEQMQLRSRVEQAAIKLNAEKPIFDSTSESFNQSALDEALTVRNGLMATGVDPVEAMQQAAELVSFKYKPAEAPVAQAEPAVPKQQPVSAKKVDTANKQPPSIGAKTGQPADTGPKLDVMQMSEEEFDNLSSEEINKLLAG